ncbi:MAG: ATP synthase F1 subunit epsilon [Phycisphaerae bacterium]
MSKTFHCTVITPEQAALECEAESVVFPAHDGELGVMINRAPLICRMGIGVLRVNSPDGDKKLFIDGGFAQIVGNKLTLLTEQAMTADDLSAEKVEQTLVEARALKVTDDESYEIRMKAIKRGEVQQKLLAGRA